jgi:hypothetical protein
MLEAICCSRCHGGAVPVEGSLCLGCRSFLGREGSERWMSEWWLAHPAPDYLRAKQQQHRRRRPILWQPDPDRKVSAWWYVVLSEPVLLAPVAVVALASGASDPTSPFLFGWLLLTVVGMIVIAAIGTFGDPDVDTEKATGSRNSTQPWPRTMPGCRR